MHPDFAPLGDSWELALQADGYAPTTIRSYRQGLGKLAHWLTKDHQDVGPMEVGRDHIRGWIVDMRGSGSPNSARSQFAGVRHFFRWMVAEGERDTDATAGVRTPAPVEAHTPVLRTDELRAMLAACEGATFTGRRDAAIIMILADGGLRLAEITGLRVTDVDTRDRVLFVIGKGSNRSGPRRRAVPLGIKATRALDRYLRERRKHPYAELPTLWLGARDRATLGPDGIDAVLKRRGAQAGISVHPHMFRHTWASEFRSAGGEEGDLMVLGGWRSRAMLDRYGKAAAAGRARDAYRSRSLGDKL